MFDKKARHESKGPGVAHINKVRFELSMANFPYTVYVTKSENFEKFNFGAWSCHLFG